MFVLYLVMNLLLVSSKISSLGAFVITDVTMLALDPDMYFLMTGCITESRSGVNLASLLEQGREKLYRGKEHRMKKMRKSLSVRC